jgi:hypothetical protein
VFAVLFMDTCFLVSHLQECFACTSLLADLFWSELHLHVDLAASFPAPGPPARVCKAFGDSRAPGPWHACWICPLPGRLCHYSAAASCSGFDLVHSHPNPIPDLWGGAGPLQGGCCLSQQVSHRVPAANAGRHQQCKDPNTFYISELVLQLPQESAAEGSCLLTDPVPLFSSQPTSASSETCHCLDSGGWRVSKSGLSVFLCFMI